MVVFSPLYGCRGVRVACPAGVQWVHILLAYETRPTPCLLESGIWDLEAGIWVLGPALISVRCQSDHAACDMACGCARRAVPGEGVGEGNGGSGADTDTDSGKSGSDYIRVFRGKYGKGGEGGGEKGGTGTRREKG